jgi:SRSO17 transposase
MMPRGRLRYDRADEALVQAEENSAAAVWTLDALTEAANAQGIQVKQPGLMSLFSRLAQRRGFRDYLTGLLAPRNLNKTLACLAGAEPVEGAQHAAVQRLQFFLSRSTWDADEVNRRRLEVLVNDPATAPHARGVIAIDDSGGS